MSLTPSPFAHFQKDQIQYSQSASHLLEHNYHRKDSLLSPSSQNPLFEAFTQRVTPEDIEYLIHSLQQAIEEHKEQSTIMSKFQRDNQRKTMGGLFAQGQKRERRNTITQIAGKKLSSSFVKNRIDMSDMAIYSSESGPEDENEDEVVMSKENDDEDCDIHITVNRSHNQATYSKLNNSHQSLVNLRKTSKPTFLDQHEQMLRALLSHSESLLKDYRSLETSLTDSQTSLRNQEHLIWEYQREIEDLKTKYEQEQESVLKVEQECQQLRQQNIVFQQEVLFKEQELKEVRGKQKQAKNDKKALENRIEEIMRIHQMEIEQVSSQNEQERILYQTIIEEKEKEISKVNNLEKQIKDFERRIDELNNDNEYLLQEMRGAIDEKKAIKKQLDEVHYKYIHDINELQRSKQKPIPMQKLSMALSEELSLCTPRDQGKSPVHTSYKNQLTTRVLQRQQSIIEEQEESLIKLPDESNHFTYHYGPNRLEESKLDDNTNLSKCLANELKLDFSNMDFDYHDHQYQSLHSLRQADQHNQTNEHQFYYGSPKYSPKGTYRDLMSERMNSSKNVSQMHQQQQVMQKEVIRQLEVQLQHQVSNITDEQQQQVKRVRLVTRIKEKHRHFVLDQKIQQLTSHDSSYLALTLNKDEFSDFLQSKYGEKKSLNSSKQSSPEKLGKYKINPHKRINLETIRLRKELEQLKLKQRTRRNSSPSKSGHSYNALFTTPKKEEKSNPYKEEKEQQEQQPVIQIEFGVKKNEQNNGKSDCKIF